MIFCDYVKYVHVNLCTLAAGHIGETTKPALGNDGMPIGYWLHSNQAAQQQWQAIIVKCEVISVTSLLFYKMNYKGTS